MNLHIFYIDGNVAIFFVKVTKWLILAEIFVGNGNCY